MLSRASLFSAVGRLVAVSRLVAADQFPIPEPTHRETFNVPVDHFDDAEDRKTFPIRILRYSKYAKEDGPIFFYSGNEGSIDGFWANTGLCFEWAEEFGADVVFAEHRYYGESLPFGQDSFKNQTMIKFLRVEQALADYALFMTSYNKNGKKKVLTMGGSYGGILSSFLRMKYPTVFDIAIAASAPIPQNFNQMSASLSPFDFYRVVTEDAYNADSNCPTTVKKGFATLAEMFKTEAGRREVESTFELCAPVKEGEWMHFMQYVRNAWTSMAMCDYPYPTNFLAKLPAWPVKAACKLISESDDPVKGLAAAVKMVYYTGDMKKQDIGAFGDFSEQNVLGDRNLLTKKSAQTLQKSGQASSQASAKQAIAEQGSQCLDMYTLFVECADQTGCGTGNDAAAWDYQMCSDITIIVASNNKTDMFPAREWTLDTLSAYCAQKYGTKPAPEAMSIRLGAWNYGSFNPQYSNIIYSNGLLDPWHPGGYLEDLSDSLVTLKIPSGAHHLDLRASYPEYDPKDVVEVRNAEKALVKHWLAGGKGQPENPIYV